MHVCRWLGACVWGWFSVGVFACVCRRGVG